METVSIKRLEVSGTGTSRKCIIGFNLDTSSITTGFYLREIGIYAIDPDTSEELLVFYGNAGDTADYISNSSSTTISQKIINVEIFLDNVANITAIIDDSVVYATLNQLQNTTDEIYATLSNNIETINNKLNTKVDKVNGKTLSTNDFSNEYKTKLDGIAAGANKIIVDSSINSSSTNPVQNKVIKTELDKKVEKSELENNIEKKENEKETNNYNKKLEIEIKEEEINMNNKSQDKEKETIKLKEQDKDKENKIIEINKIEEEKKEENKEIIISTKTESKEDNQKLNHKIIDENNIEELIGVENENEQIYNQEEKENSDDEDEPEYSKNDIEALYLRTKSNKAMKIEQFYEQKRHYFIMTEGGTPIYSRYGDEIKNCSLLATFSAIITKFTIFNNEKNSQEKLNYICNDNSIIAFLKKGKIVFIALSNKTDSISFLYSQLELLYQQLLSIVTSERMPILEEKPSSCSTVLSGINESLEQIIEYSSNTMVGLLNSYHVLPIENRQKLNNICQKYLKNALICCLITPDAKEIISLSKSNIIKLSFNDMILIQCLIMSSDSLRTGESWVPICLPGISSEGFLQLYCNFVTTDKFGIIFVTESQEQKYFNDFVNLSRKIYNEIEEQKLLKNIENSQKKEGIQKSKAMGEKSDISIVKDFVEGTIGVKEIIDKKEKEKNIRLQINKNVIRKKISIYYGVYNPNNEFIKDPLIKLKYGIVKNKLLGQFFTVNFMNSDEISPNDRYIYSKYIKLYDMFNSMNTNTINVDNYFHIEKDNKYTHGIYVTDTYVILGTFNLFKSNEEVCELLKEIAKLIKTNDGNFFANFK